MGPRLSLTGNGTGTWAQGGTKGTTPLGAWGSPGGQSWTRGTYVGSAQGRRSHLPLQRMARLRPRASAVPELMFSTSRCFTFFSTGPGKELVRWRSWQGPQDMG